MKFVLTLSMAILFVVFFVGLVFVSFLENTTPSVDFDSTKILNHSYLDVITYLGQPSYQSEVSPHYILQYPGVYLDWNYKLKEYNHISMRLHHDAVVVFRGELVTPKSQKDIMQKLNLNFYEKPLRYINGKRNKTIYYSNYCLYLYNVFGDVKDDKFDFFKITTE